MLQAIRYNREKNTLELLDQTLLPKDFIYEAIKGADDGWSAIRTMKVRGAPAIAISAALSLAIEVKDKLDEGAFTTPSVASKYIGDRLEFLTTSRPTAVNLFEVATRLKRKASEMCEASISSNEDPLVAAKKIAESFIDEAEAMLQDDIDANQAMGAFGMKYILELKKADETTKVKILTHCNTGSLATAGYGTALGVIRALQGAGRLEHAYCTETRPYNQGARLTALELVYEKIPSTLITDSMAGFLMQKGKVDAVVVGADRVAANGDTANKIGTYALSVLCKHHGIPFFIAAPTTTLDSEIKDGSHIPIEERPAKELTHVAGIQLAPEGISVWNPAFDVTPHHLITGIITERGMILKGTPDGHFDIPTFLTKTKV